MYLSQFFHYSIQCEAQPLLWCGEACHVIWLVRCRRAISLLSFARAESGNIKRRYGIFGIHNAEIVFEV